MRAPRRPSPTKVGEDVLMTGRVRGLRSWRLVPGPCGEWRLGALNGVLWERGAPTRAVCRRQRGHAEHAPAGNCQCGLYALHPWAYAASQWTRSGLSLFGTVRAWGCLQLHAEGFRAQWAEPESLFLVGASRRSEYGEVVVELAAVHGAEVWEVETMQEALRRCALEGVGLARRTVATLLDPDASDPWPDHGPKRP
jgi:hypothetical protein